MTTLYLSIKTISDTLDVSFNTAKKMVDKACYLQRKDDKIINNEFNMEALQNLANESRKLIKKYKKNVIDSTNRIYEMVDDRELQLIVNNLELHRTIPVKFTYKGKGFNDWVNYISKSSKVSEDTELIIHNLYNIEDQFIGAKQINLVDLGVGDGNTASDLILMLQSKNLMGDYYGYDISQKMLDFAKKTIIDKTGLVPKKMSVFDFEDEAMNKEYAQIQIESQNPILVLSLFGTISNSYDTEQTLKNIKKGLAKNDAILITDDIYSFEIESNFNVWKSPDNIKRYLRIPKYLGILPEDCDEVMEFNHKRSRRFVSLQLNKDIELEFTNLGKTLSLKKNDLIHLFTHKADTFEKLIAKVSSAKLKMKTHTTFSSGAILYMVTPSQD